MRIILGFLLLQYPIYCGAIAQALAQDVWNMFFHVHSSHMGTYNDMKNQTGFCKMTGFNTVSRSTSSGPALFTSGRVEFGVGLSQYQFGSLTIPSLYSKSEGALVCGMCINITSISNFPLLNPELNDYESINTTSSHIAMIFDQCRDDICTDSFLDIDVYADNIFKNANTYNISWIAIPCPTYENEKQEYLICSSTTCNAGDVSYKKFQHFMNLFDPTYFYIIVRNMQRPIKHFFIFHSDDWIELSYNGGYIWNNFERPFFENSLKIKTVDIIGKVIIDEFDMAKVLHLKPLDDYHGGIIVYGIYN